MVFFNYATMQMAAKIVYYGPGLCGKTTNLHHIYSKTSPQSRGEMVSLETETDRTLFFDLLPIDVGVIGGFKTRLQLYTVPGQVFYNTTRKLVLKGVDGIVFVADSQKAMLDANVESLRNLGENLAEIGVDIRELPLVIQLNKRDLPSALDKDTLVKALNPEGLYEWTEASAITGVGVFETLKQISKLTLKGLRKRMMGDEPQRTPVPPKRPPAAAPVETPATPQPIPAAAREASRPVPVPLPAQAGPAAGASPAAETAPPPAKVEKSSRTGPPIPNPPDLSELTELDPEAVSDVKPRGKDDTQPVRALVDSPPSPTPAAPEPAFSPPPLLPTLPEPEVEFAQTDKPVSSPVAETKHMKVRNSVDVMAELDALRKKSTQAPKVKKDPLEALAALRSPAKPVAVVETSSSGAANNSRTFSINANSGVQGRARKIKLILSFEDDDSKVLQSREEVIDLDPAASSNLSLSLKINLNP